MGRRFCFAFKPVGAYCFLNERNARKQSSRNGARNGARNRRSAGSPWTTRDAGASAGAGARASASAGASTGAGAG